MKLIDRLTHPTGTGLTDDQAASIERVACNGQVARQVFEWLTETRVANRKFYLVYVPICIIVVIILVLPGVVSTFTGESIQYGPLQLVLFSVAYIVTIYWALRYFPGVRRHRLSVALLNVMAGCDVAQKDPSPLNRGAVAKSLSKSESNFYSCWSREFKGHPPARYKREIRRVARACAAALGSYIPSTLLCDKDRFGEIQDDIARAIIRMAVGRWEQVADLGVQTQVGQERRWTDVLGARLNHQAVTGLVAVGLLVIATAGFIRQLFTN